MNLYALCFPNGVLIEHVLCTLLKAGLIITSQACSLFKVVHNDEPN